MHTHLHWNSWNSTEICENHKMLIENIENREICVDIFKRWGSIKLDMRQRKWEVWAFVKTNILDISNIEILLNKHRSVPW